MVAGVTTPRPWTGSASHCQRGSTRGCSCSVSQAAIVSRSHPLLHREATRTLLASVGETLGPYSMYLAHGLIAHVVLRALGSRRGVQTSAGIALLAGAGPGLLSALSLVATLLPLKLHYGVDARLPDVAPRALLLGAAGVVFVSYVWFAVAFQLALAGAHRVSRWKGMLAGTIAIVAFGLLCGAVEHAEGVPRVTHVLGPHLSVTAKKPHTINPSFVW